MTTLALVKECDRCNDLACRGDWHTCRGAIFDICASMELAERERNAERELDLMRLRDRPDLWRSRHTPKAQKETT